MKQDLEGEIWEDIVGYEGLYQVSNMGRVYSYPKDRIGINGARRKYNGKVLKPGAKSNDYLTVVLSKNRIRRTYTVHQLVAMAFLGHVPDGNNIVVDHVDNDKLNNNVSNLQLTTNRHNSSKDKSGYTSKHIGVSWYKVYCKWVTKIEINNKLIHLGYFHNEEEASQMYQLALSNIDKFDGNPKEFRQYLNRKKNC